ncbi:MAG: hypothetical protein ACKN9F_00625 [Methylomonas sp.]
MNNPDQELEQWLQEGDDIFAVQSLENDNWIADFDADRQLVVSKLGPYKRLFLRPVKFIQRFYHQLFPLSIESWSYRKNIYLFDNFCQIDLVLELRFQPSLAYAQRNDDLLDCLNQHIKQTYNPAIDDIINRELQALDEGSWVQTGLQDIEKRIALAVCEVLIIQHIQAQAVCKIYAHFAEFPAVQLGKDNVYFHVLKKSFETQELNNQERNRQQRLLELQELEEKQRRLEQLKQVAELELQAQAIEAEKNRRLLQEKQEQLVQQLEIEKHIHTEQLNHQAQLKAIEFDIELREKEQQQTKQHQIEILQLKAQLAHDAEIEAEKIRAQIQRRQTLLSDDFDSSIESDT